MKLFVVTILLAVCASAQAGLVARSPAVSLLDYYKTSKVEGRIIDGHAAKQGQFPWQVAILISFSEGISICGGSLISPRWVLTAAHCVAGGLEWTAVIGGVYLNVAETGRILVGSKEGFTHEKFNELMNNDIALVKLDRDVPLSDNIQTIRLPRRSDVNNALANINVTVSGYGRTTDQGEFSSNLNYVELDTITNEKCAELFGPQLIISSTICCVGRPQHSICMGDSGGPLIRYESDGKPTQIGIVSFVHVTGCSLGNPSAFVRTASYLDWIHEKTGIPIRD